MPYSAYTAFFTAVLGLRASSAALTTGQIVARLNLPAPGVTLRGGRLPHREGGVASITGALGVAEGDELNAAEGDVTGETPAP